MHRPHSLWHAVRFVCPIHTCVCQQGYGGRSSRICSRPNMSLKRGQTRRAFLSASAVHQSLSANSYLGCQTLPVLAPLPGCLRHNLGTRGIPGRARVIRCLRSLIKNGLWQRYLSLLYRHGNACLEEACEGHAGLLLWPDGESSELELPFPFAGVVRAASLKWRASLIGRHYSRRLCPEHISLSYVIQLVSKMQ